MHCISVGFPNSKPQKSKEWPNFKSPEIQETEDLMQETEKTILRMRVRVDDRIKCLPGESSDQTAVGHKTLEDISTRT